MRKMRAKVIPLITVALRTVSPQLEKWLQQIPAITSEIPTQKTVLGTAKILRRTLDLPGRGLEVEGDTYHPRA